VDKTGIKKEELGINRGKNSRNRTEKRKSADISQMGEKLIHRVKTGKKDEGATEPLLEGKSTDWIRKVKRAETCSRPL